MTNEMIQKKAEELFGKVDKTFPLTEFAKERDRKCFKQGAQWAIQQMIDEACRWLERNSEFYSYRELDEYDMQYYARMDKKKMIEDFKRAMETDYEK